MAILTPVDTPEAPSRRRSRLVMGIFLLTAGAAHFLAPNFFDEIVPGWLPPSKRFWTNASGVVELGAGAALLNRRTSRPAAWVALALFIGVYPANIKDAVDHWPFSDSQSRARLIRLPLQFPLFAWAWKLAHS